MNAISFVFELISKGFLIIVLFCFTSFKGIFIISPWLLAGFGCFFSHHFWDLIKLFKNLLNHLQTCGGAREKEAGTCTACTNEKCEEKDNTRHHIIVKEVTLRTDIILVILIHWRLHCFAVHIDTPYQLVFSKVTWANITCMGKSIGNHQEKLSNPNDSNAHFTAD